MTLLFEGDVTIAGVRLYARLEGPAGAPVVAFANSLATDCGIWDAQVPALSARYRVLRYDARGHGRSATPPGPYDIGMLADDLLGLLAHFEAGRAHVAGVSLGGLTALEVGLRAPSKVASVSAFASRADMPPHFQKGIDDRNQLVREQGTQAIASTMVERWFTRATLDAGGPELDRIRAMVAGTPVDGFVACTEAIKTAGLRERVGGLTTASLFGVGDEDAALPVELMREMQLEVAGSRFAVLPNAGHLCNVEQPAAFNAVLQSFLERVEAGG